MQDMAPLDTHWTPLLINKRNTTYRRNRRTECALLLQEFFRPKSMVKISLRVHAVLTYTWKSMRLRETIKMFEKNFIIMGSSVFRRPFMVSHLMSFTIMLQHFYGKWSPLENFQELLNIVTPVPTNGFTPQTVSMSVLSWRYLTSNLKLGEMMAYLRS